jgi:hypothetical protein
VTADRIVVDRFDVANAAFWLDMVALWLEVPDHAHQLACDLWAHPEPIVDTGRPLTVIIGRAAAALRASLDADSHPEDR